MTSMNIVSNMASTNTSVNVTDSKSQYLIGCPHLIKEFANIGVLKIFSGDNHSFVLAKNKVEFVYNEIKQINLDTTLNTSKLNESNVKSNMNHSLTPRDLQTRIQTVCQPDFVKNVDVESLVNMNIDFSEIKIENKIAEGG